MKREAAYFDFIAAPVPTRPHRGGGQVGTEKRNENNAVPTVPTIPTTNHGSADAAMGPDLDALEERAAIILEAHTRCFADDGTPLPAPIFGLSWAEAERLARADVLGGSAA